MFDLDIIHNRPDERYKGEMEEKFLLSVVMRFYDQPAVQDAVKFVEEKHFGSAIHRAVWRAVMATWEAGERPEYRRISSILFNDDAITHIKRTPIESIVAEMEFEDTRPEEAGQWARGTHEGFRSRMLQGIWTKGVNLLARERWATDRALEWWLEKLPKIPPAIGSARIGITDAPDIIHAMLKRCESEDEAAGITMGIPGVDQAMIQIPFSRFVLLGGKSGFGKSSLALQACLYNAKEFRIPSLYISLEMARDDLMLRTVCMEAGISTEPVESGMRDVSDEYIQALMDATTAITNLPLNFEYLCGPKTNELDHFIREQVARTGAKIVVVDYADKVRLTRRKDHEGVVPEEVGGTLHDLAKDLDIVLICLQVYSTQRFQESVTPTNTWFLGGIRWEYYADIILHLQRPDPMLENLTDLHNTKWKNREPLPSMPLCFQGDRGMRFVDWQ